MKKVIILGVNADIGFNFCNFLNDDKVEIIGTYRKIKPIFKKDTNKKIKLIKCDISKDKDLQKLFHLIKKEKFTWDTFFSSVGTSLPIGKFFDTNFDDWSNSVKLNSIYQLKVIHKISKFRKKKSNIIFLAGGGTNNTFRYYSAYCASKIFLIKMCELIDDEYPGINCFIVGPGRTRTKTHLETLKYGIKNDKNFKIVKKFWDSKNQGTPFYKIYECIKWCCSVGRNIVGGRNISVQHDKWGSSSLIKQLRNDRNKFKIRRFRNK